MPTITDATRDFYFRLEKEINNYLIKGIRGPELKKYFARYKKEMIEQLKIEVWQKLRSMSELEKQELNAIAEPILKGFTHMADELEKDVIFEMKVDDTRDKKAARIQHRLGAQKYIAKTIVKTGQDAITQAKRINDSLEAGFEHFKYIGPAPDRKFCREHYNKTYSKKEIEEMNNDQGLPVMYYCGGYNCHHQWVGVISIDEKGNVTSEVLPIDKVFGKYFVNPEKIDYHSSMTKEEIEDKTQHIEKLFKEYQINFDNNQKFVLEFSSRKREFGSITTSDHGKFIYKINFGHEVDRARISSDDIYLQKSRVDEHNLKYSTIVHEFGHLITTHRQKIHSDRESEFWEEVAKIKREHRKEYDEYQAKYYSVVKEDSDKAKEFFKYHFLGNYGTTTKGASEFMAEAFVNYKLSSNPSKYAKQIGELIKKTYGRE